MDYSYFRNGEHIGEPDNGTSNKLSPALIWLLRILLPLLLVATFFVVYSGSLDAITYDKTGEWLVFVIIFIIVPVLAGNSWRVWVSGDWRMGTYLLGASSVLINGPIYGIWSGRHEENVFRATGVRAKAVVTSSFYSKGARMYYEFDVAGKRYESFNTHNPGGYMAGDTVNIIYARDIPNMNSPVELIGK